MYDANDSVASWMIAGGARIEEPDPRQLAHLMALREAKQDARRPLAPFARFGERFGAKPQARAERDAMTSCCAAA